MIFSMKKSILFGAALTLGIASCSKVQENEKPSQTPQDNSRQITITAYGADPESRASLEATALTWLEDDYFLLYDMIEGETLAKDGNPFTEKSNGAFVVDNETIDDHKADFAGTIRDVTPAADRIFFAFHAPTGKVDYNYNQQSPYVDLDGNDEGGDWVQVQTGTSNPVELGGKCRMWGDPVILDGVAPSSDNLKFAFRQLCATIDMKIKDFPADYSILSVAMEDVDGTNGNLNAFFTRRCAIDLSTRNANLIYGTIPPANFYKRMVVKFATPINGGQDFNANMVIFPHDATYDKNGALVNEAKGPDGTRHMKITVTATDSAGEEVLLIWDKPTCPTGTWTAGKRKSSTLAFGKQDETVRPYFVNYPVVEIYNEKGLKWVAAQTNDTESTYGGFEGYTVELMNDIAISSWGTPIGTLASPFKGNFNGGGFTISGLNNTSGLTNFGIFGVVAPTGTKSQFKDVTISEAVVQAGEQSGIFVGKATNVKFENIVLDNVKFTTSTGYPSGIFTGEIGNGVEFDGCHITNSTLNPQGRVQVGGFTALVNGVYSSPADIVKFTDCTVENCTMTTTSNNNNNGAFVGVVQGLAVNIDQCEVINTTIATGFSTTNNSYGTGGFIGSITTNTIDAYNVISNSKMKGGYIKGTGAGVGTNMGGIVGCNSALLKVANCSNSAEVIHDNSAAEGGSANGLGGICGASKGVNSNIVIVGCKNSAKIAMQNAASGQAWHVGGIIGNAASTGLIASCYNTADIKGHPSTSNNGNRAGGIAGVSALSISACYSTGVVTSGANNNTRGIFCSGTLAGSAIETSYYKDNSSANPIGIKAGTGDPEEFAIAAWPADTHKGWGNTSPTNWDAAYGTWTNYWSSIGTFGPVYPKLSDYVEDEP